jgi:cyclic pyranopterin phosphate synthase
MTPKPLSHLDPEGHAHMVSIGHKPVAEREAIAEGLLFLLPETRDALLAGTLPKGDALATARIAGIMAAKQTSMLIPLCHPIQTTHVAVTIEPVDEPFAVRVTATIRVVERTGAEMEALTAVTVALLTLYDMLKGVQKDMRLGEIRLRRKTGGTSGDLQLP